MAFFINTQLPQDPNVHYHGKVLPGQKAPPAKPVEDPTVNYAGKQLPSQATKPVKQPVDLSNNPSLVVIGGVTLPPDTAMFKNGEKIVPMSKILDGVSVVEHVGRAPYEIEFEGTFRAYNSSKTQNVFPQQLLDDFWTKVWLPDSVQTIQNTYLNNLGIQELIIKSVHTETFRGSTNVRFKLKTIENVPGTTLIAG